MGLPEQEEHTTESSEATTPEEPQELTEQGEEAQQVDGDVEAADPTDPEPTGEDDNGDDDTGDAESSDDDTGDDDTGDDDTGDDDTGDDDNGDDDTGDAESSDDDNGDDDTGADDTDDDETGDAESSDDDTGDDESGDDETGDLDESSEAETGDTESSDLDKIRASEEGVEDESEGDLEEDGRAWFVVHCYSGYENKVRHNLEQRIETMGMKDKIFDIVVPTEEEIEVKEGKRRTIERRVFPGYILVYMVMSEESWYVVRNTPGVTGFVGMGNEPTPLRPEEVSLIIKRMEADAPRIKVTFKSGERVRIVDGPFNDFRGTVSEIDMERAKVRVMVNFFGRETPIELDFLQVEKT